MINDLNWRYATKKFDPSKKIPDQQFNELLEALRLSPSSYGLQPWKFVVVKDPQVRNELKANAWNQPQITDADVLIVLCALKTMDEKYVKHFVQSISQTRGTPIEALAGYEQMMIGTLKGKSPDELSHWMKRQVYIALGVLMAECAQRKIDACPMEGFDSKKFDEILNLSQEGVESVVLCPVGYRDQDDQYAQLKKVRFDHKEIFINR